MLDSEFVAVGAETQARLSDIGVMPKPGGEGEQAKPDYRRQGPMRHDCHDGLRRGSRQPDPRADRLRGRLHRAEDVRRHRLHDRRPHGGGVSGEGGLMIHCSKEETEALPAKPGARPFEMRGREMKGWLRVDAESVSTKRALEPWAMQSVAFAGALPPKEKK